MTIDALPPAPVPTDSAAAFDAKAFAFAAALDLFGIQANALGAIAQTNSDIAVSLLLGMSLPTYGDTSSTSLTIGTGTKVFTTSTGKAWVAGQTVVASNGANYMKGLVTSYSGSTLTVNVATVNGSGTFASWAIGLSCNEAAARLATGAAALTIPAAFSARKSGSQLTGNVILFDTIQHQTGAGYATGTGLFTAPITGWYSFSAGVRGLNNFSGTTSYLMTMLIQGGATLTNCIRVVGGSGGVEYFTMNVAAYYLNAGDIVEVIANIGLNVSSGLTVPIDSSNYFSGVFLGT